MANENRKDFNAMLHDSKDMPCLLYTSGRGSQRREILRQLRQPRSVPVGRGLSVHGDGQSAQQYARCV